MVDKKQGAGSKGGKPDETTSSKIPKPLLDLKATEVRSSSPASDGKPASTSSLKGAPDWSGERDKPQTPAGSSAAASTPSSASGSDKSATQSTTASGSTSAAGATGGSVKSAMSSLPSRPDSKSATGASGAGGAASSAASAATAEKSTTSAAGASGRDGSPGGRATSAATAKKSAEERSPPAGPRKSGGGLITTVSHLAAGIVGGAIALFAAEPIEQQFGVALTAPAKVPAVIEQRIAALEAAKVTAATNGVSSEAVDKIASQVATAEARLAKLTDLEAQVSAIAGDLKNVQEARQKAPANSSGEGAGSGEVAALRSRLAKLESTLASLSSATASDGKPAGIAPLAQFSARFADLETSVSTQLESLRKDLVSEVDTRIAPTVEASAKAVAGAERLDREISEIKTEAARLDQRSNVMKAATDKLSATVRVVGEQAANLKVELDTLTGDLKQELTKVVRPADVEKSIAPVADKVALIEKNLGSVLASETARKKNAERIVLSLELSNLKRVLDRGAPYAAELADVKKIAGNSIDFGALEAHMGNGVPTGQELARQFRNVAYKIIHAEDADANASRIDRLFAAAKSIVQVRRTDIPATEKTAEAAVARIEQHLKQGDLSGALALAEKLPDQAKAPVKDWISQLAARAGVDRAIAQIEDQLKSSLGGAVPGGKG